MLAKLKAMALVPWPGHLVGLSALNPPKVDLGRG